MESLKCHGLGLVILILLAIPGLQVEADDLSTPDQEKCLGISRGKHFILGFTDSSIGRNRELSITVVAFSDQQTTVTISSKHRVEGRPFQESFVIEAGGYRRTTVPAELMMDGTERSLKGIEITASSEVSVYGLMYQSYTTDGFLGIPTNNLGLQYVVVQSSIDNMSHFAVIGTQDSTSIQVTLRGPVTFEGQSYSPGDVLSFMVNKLEAVQLQGTQDFTGSIVQSDKPAAVFTGSECESNPGTACDTLTEQLVPVKSWGKKHIYTAFQSTGVNFYQIVAYFSGTDVSIPGFANQSLDAGDFWEGRLSGSGLVSSSKPTLMMQKLAFINEAVDPSLIQVPSEEQFGFVFGFATPPNAGADSEGFFNFINIIVKMNAQQTVYLNGSPINGTDVHRSEVPYTDYTSISVQLPKGEGVYFVEQTDPLSSPLSVIVYGYERTESYGYAAGLSLPSNKQLLSLSPYYLRELGGETFRMTVPCLQANLQSDQSAKCKFSTGIGEVLESGYRVDSYTVICITPTFYKNGLTPVYVSLDDGVTFPYSGVVYIASEEDLQPLLKVHQMNTQDGPIVINITTDDPLIFTWVPNSLGNSVNNVDIMMQDSNYSSSGHPVLLEEVNLKQGVSNNGEFQISTTELLPYFHDDNCLTQRSPSLVFFYLKPHTQQRSDDWVNLNRFYSGVKYMSLLEVEPIKESLRLSFRCKLFIKRLKKVPWGLKPCPCTSAQANVDSLNFVESNELISYYHPGAKDCFRSTTSSTTGSGQQCCYRADGNILIGPPGGGTADTYSPQDHFFKHQWYDVLPWLGCCKWTKNCDTYYKYRPSDDCSNYVPPEPAAGTGDPHIISLDGKRFTFNGAGEYLMASSALHNLTFQSRMGVYRDKDASVYTAFVVQTNDSSVVQVQMSSMNETLILVDGEPLLLASNPLLVHHLKNLRISFTPDFSEVRIAFSAGVAIIVYMKPDLMSFTAQLDTKFRGQVKGLLGNLNGDPDDDLQFPNGTIMNTNSSIEEVHKYGQHWLVAKEESIFTYISPYDYDTYYVPEFSPRFDVPDPDAVSPEIKALCGHSLECIFDAVTTGSLSFANETLVVTGIIDQIQKSSVKVVSCGFPGVVVNATMAGSVYLVNSTVKVTCYNGFNLKGSPTLTCQINGLWSSSLPLCINMRDEQTDRHLSTLAITLIVFGAVAGLCLILSVIGFLVVKQKKINSVNDGSSVSM